MPRRAFLALGAGAALAGCGFQPVYMPTASGQAGPAQRELAAINVNLIADRPGMLLRQALQDRFEGAERRHRATLRPGGQFLDYRQRPRDPAEHTVTRVRLIGHATWTLHAQDLARTNIINGSARAADAENILDTQYFAADLENETIQKRLAGEVADQITLQLAAFFRKRAAQAG